MDQFQQLHSIYVQWFFYGCALYMMLSVAWWVEKQARKGGEQNESTGADHGHGRSRKVVGYHARLRQNAMPRKESAGRANR
jgi:hypothetical protein